MAGYEGGVSVPGRVNVLEQEVHTLKHQVKMLEDERLPMRVHHLEGVAENTRETLAELRHSSSELTKQVHGMREELGADLMEFREALGIRVTKLETKIAIYLSVAVAMAGFIGWALQSPAVRAIINLASAMPTD